MNKNKSKFEIMAEKSQALANAKPTDIIKSSVGKREEPKEINFRNIRLQTYLTKEEYNLFIAKIGREPISNKVRELVMNFINS